MADAQTKNDTALRTDRMRVATRKAHDLSNSLINLKLLVALTSRTVYGQCLLLFYYVFAQIELSMQAQQHNSQLKQLQSAFQPLVRSEAFVKDLDFYLGPDWSKKYKAPPAVEAYVKRIQEVEKTDPILLVAYAYHMYAAMLAGGQIVGRTVKRSFGLEDENGLQTFEFPGKSKMALRDPLREAVNKLDLDAATEERLLAESLRVFQMNNDVVKGIEGTFRQLVLWLSKYAIVFTLIYFTYTLFVKDTPRIFS